MGGAYTISIANDKHAEEHSRRSYTPRSAERTLQGENIVLYDCGDDREHFNAFFRPAIEEYNMKQKRSDRKKDLDYLSALESGREGYGKGKRQEKPFYHDVIQIGNRDTNGITDDDFDVDHWRSLKAEHKFEEAADYVRQHKTTTKEKTDFIEILTEVGKEILENKDGRYNGILVHGLTIHNDEPNGTPHLDFRYTFCTSGEKTGIGTRVSMTKALGKLGYKTDPQMTALQKFRESIKDRIEEKMKERGYQREVKNEKRMHLSTAAYEAEQRLKEKEADVADAERRLREKEAKVKEAELKLKDREAEVRRIEADGWEIHEANLQKIEEINAFMAKKKAEFEEIKSEAAERDRKSKKTWAAVNERERKAADEEKRLKEQKKEQDSREIVIRVEEKSLLQQTERNQLIRKGMEQREKEISEREAELEEEYAERKKQLEEEYEGRSKSLERKESQLSDGKQWIDDTIDAMCDEIAGIADGYKIGHAEKPESNYDKYAFTRDLLEAITAHLKQGIGKQKSKDRMDSELERLLRLGGDVKGYGMEYG